MFTFSMIYCFHTPVYGNWKTTMLDRRNVVLLIQRKLAAIVLNMWLTQLSQASGWKVSTASNMPFLKYSR